jgi:hypothetical protein
MDLAHDVKVAVIASAAILLVLLAVPAGHRQTPRYVLSAVFATAITAFFALRSGRRGRVPTRHPDQCRLG